MKIIFLLDERNEYVEVEPSTLQLRQISPDTAALGVETLVPVTNEDGTNKTNEEGQVLYQKAFRPFVNYPVVISLPAQPTPEVPATPEVE